MGGWLPRNTTPIQQVVDTVERGAPAEDLELVDRLPAQECAEQTAEAQDMIEMPVCQQDPRQVLEACAGLQDLTLRAFAAIDQKTILAMFDDQG